MIDYRSILGPSQNILIVTPCILPQKGGVATTVTAVAEALARRGNQVSVILRTTGSRSRVVEIESKSRDLGIFSLRLRGPVNQERPFAGVVSFLVHAPRTLRALVRFVRQRHIDAINLHYPTASDIYWIWIRVVTGVPLFVTIHGSDLALFESRPLLHRLIVRGLLRVADGILHSTKAFLEQSLVHIYPAARAKAALIPLAIDLGDFSAPDGTLPFTVPSRFILCVAKLAPVKGVDILLKAFAQLSDFPDEHLIVVGDGPSRAQLQQLADSSGLAGRVSFLGALERQHVVTLMRQCLFFVLPSRFESFGLVNLEAHASGKAVIATRVGGVPEVVQEGVSGLLVEPEDVEGLRDRMRTLIKDDGLRARLGLAGQHQIAARGLTWDNYAEKCLAVFAESAPTNTRSR